MRCSLSILAPVLLLATAGLCSSLASASPVGPVDLVGIGDPPAANDPALRELPGIQLNVSPDGHETAVCVCRPATAAEQSDPALAPDGWVQEGPRESYGRDTVPLPLVPDWVGTRVRATGALIWFDADHDGDQDLFVGTYWANQYPPLVDYYNFIYLNDGGMLENEPSWISSDQRHTGDAEVGRINNDAYPDLFLANGGTSFQPSQVFFGQAGLLPTSAGWQSIGGTWATGCALADFDRDGDLDVATSNQGLSPDPYRPTYLFRNSGGSLESSPFWQSYQVGITGDCAWGDMDGDDYPDLAVSGWSSWNTGVFRNLGTTLDPGFCWTTGAPGRTDKGVAWADVDGDDLLDLAVGGNGDPDWLFRNEGTLLGAAPVWASGESYTGCQDIAWVDIDRDGDPDLATINFSTGHVRIYLNNGGVLSTLADWQYDAASSGSAIAFGDVNGDGWLDLAIGVANGPIELFINEGLPMGVGDRPADSSAQVRVLLTTGASPARGELAIALAAPRPARLERLELIDPAGRIVARCADAARAFDGSCRLSWNPISARAAGVYLLRASGWWGEPGCDGTAWSATTRVVWCGR